MQPAAPCFSIILTYKDREDFLPRTLRSLLGVKLRPLQVILVDNSSIDSSPRICEDFQRKHDAEDFKILCISEPTPGASSARNAGLAAATTEYVYFFDSDDQLSPEFFSDILTHITSRSRAVNEGKQYLPHVVAAPTRMVFPDGTTEVRFHDSRSRITDQILTGMFSTQSMVLRRDFLLHLGGWNERLPKWNDWELGIRLLQGGADVMWLPKSYHHIYQHPASLTALPPETAFAAEQEALRSARRLLTGQRDCMTALGARAFIMSMKARRMGMKQEAACLKEEFPLPSPLRQLLALHARVYNKGIWRTARLFL